MSSRLVSFERKRINHLRPAISSKVDKPLLLGHHAAKSRLNVGMFELARTVSFGHYAGGGGGGGVCHLRPLRTQKASNIRECAKQLTGTLRNDAKVQHLGVDQKDLRIG